MSIARYGLWFGLVVLGCSGHTIENRGAVAGIEGAACYPNGTCNSGLTCASRLCVLVPNGNADASSTGGRGSALEDAGQRGFDASTPPVLEAGPRTSFEGGSPGCPDVASGYTGDDRCIAPPEASAGFQLHYGPRNYDDPVEVASFILAPGDETVACIFRKTPNQRDAHAGAVRMRYRPGIFRMIAYTQGTAVVDNSAPAACAQGTDFQPIVYAPTDDTTIAYAGSPKAPEHAGAALAVPAQSQVALQAHAVNTTDQPTLTEGWLNVTLVPESDVKMEIAPITWLGGLGMNIPPATHAVVAAGAGAGGTPVASCQVPAGGDVQIYGLTADVHSHNVRTSAHVERAGTAQRNLFYESYDWSHPFAAVYDSVHANPAPDPGTKIGGGLSGDLVLHPGDSISWECEIQNDTSVSLRFSDRVFSGETCNLFGFGTPAPWPVSCITL